MSTSRPSSHRNNEARSTLYPLITSIRDQLLPILKSLANDKRLIVLISLLNGPQSFQSLMEISALQKTALSNHLTILMDTHLIFKPSYANYDLTSDGEKYLRTMYTTWMQSTVRHNQQLTAQQERPLSRSFLSTLKKREFTLDPVDH